MSRLDLSRRRLVAVGLKLLPVVALARSLPARAAASGRSLTFFNTHTQEEVTAVYSYGREHDPATLERFNAVLRDHRSGEIGRMDPALFDFLHSVAERAGAAPTFEVISGFRSQASNELLRSRNSGVAQGSLHLQGKAIDVRLRGVSCAKLRDIALELARGGVGYYPKSDFVHLDTGRVRRWGA